MTDEVLEQTAVRLLTGEGASREVLPLDVGERDHGVGHGVQGDPRRIYGAPVRI